MGGMREKGGEGEGEWGKERKGEGEEEGGEVRVYRWEGERSGWGSVQR